MKLTNCHTFINLYVTPFNEIVFLPNIKKTKKYLLQLTKANCF